MVDEGFCVFALDYGNRATGPSRTPPPQLDAFVGRVLAATGAAKVSMVGHSQGGMMPRYYIKFLGGRSGRRRPRRACSVEPRHLDERSPRQPVHRVTGAGRVLPGLHPADGRLGVPHQPQRRRRDPGPVSYTQHHHAVRRGGLPHTSGYLEPGDRTTNLTHPGQVPQRPGRAPPDPYERHRDRPHPRRTDQGWCCRPGVPAGLRSAGGLPRHVDPVADRGAEEVAVVVVGRAFGLPAPAAVGGPDDQVVGPRRPGVQGRVQRPSRTGRWHRPGWPRASDAPPSVLTSTRLMAASPAQARPRRSVFCPAVASPTESRRS